MPEPFFYSIRMHASTGGAHLSGAERIVTADQIDTAISELVRRAMSKASQPDRIAVSIDSLGLKRPRPVPALGLLVMSADSWQEGRRIAGQMLLKAGVSASAINSALDALSSGAAFEGKNMRGAMIMDAKTGERLEPDCSRGVRASRFDWSPEAEPEIAKKLEERGLSHFRTREALALATKVAHGPGVIAELCWSDDPDYTAGYVASLPAGYIRIPLLKQSGDDKGGRAIFIDPGRTDVGELIAYLETEAVFIDIPDNSRPGSRSDFGEGI